MTAVMSDISVVSEISPGELTNFCNTRPRHLLNVQGSFARLSVSPESTNVFDSQLPSWVVHQLHVPGRGGLKLSAGPADVAASEQCCMESLITHHV
jgi:hypothetical protein